MNENPIDKAGVLTSHSEQVSAVCVTYHPDAGLLERLSIVLNQVSHLVIVDNGSSPEAVRMLKTLATRENVTVIYCHENLGIARALNVGIERAAERDCDYLLLLDQDTRAYDDLVTVLLGILRLNADHNRKTIVGAGYTGASQAEPRPAEPMLAYEEVEAVIQSGSLLSLDSYRDIGPFRDEFFIDHVDTEYCNRARRKGYLVVQSKRPLMIHSIGDPSEHQFLWMKKSTPNHSADRHYYQTRNDTIMLRESGRYPGSSWYFKSLSRTFRRCKRVALFESQKTKKIIAIAQGWRDGVTGRGGRRAT